LKLYELTEAMIRAQSIIDDETIDPETGEVKDPSKDLKEILDAVEMAFDEKIENIVRLVKKVEYEATVIKIEETRLARRRASREKIAAWLKMYSQQAMDAVRKDKISTALFTIWVQESEGGTEIMKNAVVPEEFLGPAKPRDPDKKALKKALKSGMEIPGIRIGEGKRGLRIK
jgi:hypothetical protein